MASPNEIAGLKLIAVKPKLWRITDAIDGKYTLEFSWFDQDKTDFIFVPTQRKPTRYYASLKILMRDIASVDSNAVIQLQFN